VYQLQLLIEKKDEQICKLKKEEVDNYALHESEGNEYQSEIVALKK